MLCSDQCPRGTSCHPLSNVVADDGSSFVCVGLHGEEKPVAPEDRFRHCFRSETTDSVFDYDLYDLKSCISVMADALLLDELSDSQS